MRYTNRWELPEVTFYQVEGVIGHDEPLFAYGRPNAVHGGGKPRTGELYESLDRAMISWVAEKYTGPRGAGGSGVGTAADWFARMIGMDQLVAVDYEKGREALRQAIVATETARTPAGAARAAHGELEKRGLVLAARVES